MYLNEFYNSQQTWKYLLMHLYAQFNQLTVKKKWDRQSTKSTWALPTLLNII